MSVSYLTPSFDAPADVTRSPIEGSLAHDLATGTTTAALTFAGQGWRWWDDLESLLGRRPWLRDRARRWSDRIAELSAEAALADLAALRHGFDPLRWIDDARTRPDDGELSALAVSLPGVLLTQLLAYREAWEDGLSHAVEAGSLVAATGHSGGVIAAAAVAARPDGLDDDDAVGVFLELSVLLGHLAGTCSHAVPPAVLTAAMRGDVDAPAPMVAVAGVRLDRLAEVLATDLTDGAARIALRHGASRAVISGTPAALGAARAALQSAVRSDPGAAPLVWEPLAVSAPCHHPVLSEVAASVVDAARRHDLVLADATNGIALVLPDGPRSVGPDDDLVHALVDAMLVRPGHWDRTAVALATGSAGTRPAKWLLDLGPSDGVARLSAGATSGLDTAVLALATDDDRRALVTSGAVDDRRRATYDRFAPRLVTLPDGTTRVENRFTRTTGRAPIVLAGMTPTTVDAPIVAAAANAGFVAELAGGGQVTEAIFSERLAELAELLEPGAEVVLNTLHLDPYLWGLHLGRSRLVQTARRDGAPISGVTVSAGIPDTDAAVALLDELAELGMWCNAFKPGTHDQVRQVAAIAAAAPQHLLMVHVEGGQAGGHHSWVDLDDLLLGGYRELRSHDNVVLCAGGGVGTPERAVELLTGRWALRHGDVEMPVDGVLIGTAAMAAAEATATPGVKAALVDAPGIGTRVARGRIGGGVTSGRSGLDADIHFLDNAASRCAALLDQVAGDADAVVRRHDEIVAALARTAKPWFGDVAAMTYEQLLRRFVELAAVGRDGRYEDGVWLDRTHRERFVSLLQRAEARLHPAQSGRVETAFAATDSVDDPGAAIDELVRRYPRAATTRLHPADPAFFLHVCRAPGKPVPFVPVLDGDVRRWYQSDSLWQAQHPAYDADQVLIIPGPAAVSGITVPDEPVADLLARFDDAVRDDLLAAGATPSPVVRLRRHGEVAGLGGPVAALLAAPTVLVDGAVRPNPVLRLAPSYDWQLTAADDGRLIAAELSARSAVGNGVRGDDCPIGEAESVELLAGELGTSEQDTATLTITWPALRRYGTANASTAGPTAAPTRSESVTLHFVHDQHHGSDVVALDTRARQAQLSDLLHDVLVGEGHAGAAIAPVSLDGVRRRRHASLIGADPGATPLPDSLLAVVWPAVFRSLADDAVVGSLLDLVHLEHRVRILDPGALAAADAADTLVDVDARIERISDHDAGTRVDTVAEVRDGDVVLAVVHGGFLLRGTTLDPLRYTPAQPTGDDTAVEVVDRPRRTLAGLMLRAPLDLRQVASITGDHNPIHRSTAVARFAGLDGPIVHGAWTSAGAQRAVVEAACDGRPERLVDMAVSFVGVVHPGDEVSYSVVRRGVAAGDTAYTVTASVAGPDGAVPVLTAEAIVCPPRTAYLFPGQGIQRQGMGMDGYERSAAARDVWDRADRHTRAALGFSILSIVRDNPTVVSVASPDGDAEVHRHPLGVLHLTQFTQVAMAALAIGPGRRAARRGRLRRARHGAPGTPSASTTRSRRSEGSCPSR